MRVKLRVGVLCGGWSSERSVSLKTGAAIERALRTLGHDPILIDVDRNLIERLRTARLDVCYNAMHGTFGEDGQLQALLSFLEIPFTGEDFRTSVVAFDKLLSKQIYSAANISMPQWMVLNADTELDAIESSFDYPVFIKPSSEGSSVGVERVTSAFELEARKASWAEIPYVLEASIEGPELSVVCWGDSVIGSVEIVPDRSFYDYEAKYGDANTTYHVPPRLDTDLIASAEAMALRAHQALGCRSLCRTDVMVDDNGVYVLETNTLPGMTETSLVPKVAAANGIEFPELVQKVIEQSHGLPDGGLYG